MIYSKENPIGIEAYIHNIQEKFDADFDMDVFGLAEINEKNDLEVPQVFDGNEYKDVLYSEQDKMFFTIGSDFTPDGFSNQRVDLYVYFCFNLSNISTTERHHTEIRTKCINTFRSCGGGDFDVQVGFKKITSDFSVGNMKGKDIHPYHWFRFKKNVSFKINQTTC